MKIVKRYAYMINNDELIMQDLNKVWGKIMCNYLNEHNDNNLIFYQLVSDEFKLKLRDKE